MILICFSSQSKAVHIVHDIAMHCSRQSFVTRTMCTGFLVNVNINQVEIRIRNQPILNRSEIIIVLSRFRTNVDYIKTNVYMYVI